MMLVAVTDRVVQIKAALGEGYRRRPEILPESSLRPHQGITGELPLKEIGGLQHGEDLSKSLSAGFQRAGADRVPGIFVLPDERIGEITAVDRINVAGLFRRKRHIAASPLRHCKQLGSLPDH